MSEYDRRVDIIKSLCRFCPICAAELIMETVTRKIRMGSMTYTIDIKRCSNGHGEMDAGMGDGNLGPAAIFELNEELFKEGFQPAIKSKEVVGLGKPTNCPVCSKPLIKSKYSEDKLFCNPWGGRPHGTYDLVEEDGQKVYKWFAFVAKNE